MDDKFSLIIAIIVEVMFVMGFAIYLDTDWRRKAGAWVRLHLGRQKKPEAAIPLPWEPMVPETPLVKKIEAELEVDTVKFIADICELSGKVGRLIITPGPIMHNSAEQSEVIDEKMYFSRRLEVAEEVEAYAAAHGSLMPDTFNTITILQTLGYLHERPEKEEEAADADAPVGG